MIPKRFDDISKADIDALLADGVPEGRTIDYKQSLPGGTDDEKREFLADVSAFANAAGGDIIYGVEEDNGIPTSANGLPHIDPDSENLRLDSCIRSGIEPRVPAVQIKAVDGFPAGPVMVLRVPKSWSSPHMVTFKKLSRFFSRTNAGKFQMDVTEIRSAFALSEAVTERARRFRDERLSQVVADETPVRLVDGPKLVFHLLPLISLTSGFQLDVSQMKRQEARLRPIGSSGAQSRFNVDGVITLAWSQRPTTYCQMFRSGRIESVWADFVVKRDGHRFVLRGYEQYLLVAVQQYLEALRDLEVPCPMLGFLSIIGAAGAHMEYDCRYFNPEDLHPIDRNMLVLPDVLIEDYGCDLRRILRPIFDAMWNATGYERSMNHDPDGNVIFPPH